MLILQFKNAEQKLKERVEKEQASQLGLASWLILIYDYK
jgi:hypothetical protein